MEEIKEEHNMKKQKFLRRLSEEEKKELFDAIRDGNDDEGAKQVIEIMEDMNEEIKYDIFNSGSALHFSCEYGRIELVKYLIELGADVDNICEGWSPLMKASIFGHIEIVKLLIDAGAELNYTDENGNSVLSEAALNLEIFEFFISSGIDMDKCGGMALSIACLNGNINITQRLIELGVNVNFVDSQFRKTPLHYACVYSKTEVVKFLMEHGSDETIQDKEGNTAIEMTENEEIKEFIINYKPSKFVLK